MGRAFPEGGGEGGCLLRLLLFLILLPIVLTMPPLAFSVFAFFAYTLYFYRKG